MRKKKAVIVIPAYNERAGIKKIIPEIFDLAKDIPHWHIQVLIADDNSPDGTFEQIELFKKKYNDLFIIQGKKEGFGKAYVRGIGHALKTMRPDVIFEMDADCQHNPDLIPSFLESIDKGADFVIGSRYIPGGSVPDAWSLKRKFYSGFGNIIARIGFMKLSVHDWTSGYRCIHADFLKNVLSSMEKYNGYVFQIALLDKAIKHNLNISEIPLEFLDRKEGLSKFKSLEYIFDSLLYIFTQSSFIRFVIVGLLGFVVDFAIAAFLISVFDTYKPHANAISAECAILFNFVMNNFWSFSHKKAAHSLLSYIKKFINFNIVASGSIIIQWFGIYSGLVISGDKIINTPVFPIESWILYKVFTITFVIIPYSYFMYNRFIWKDKTRT